MRNIELVSLDIRNFKGIEAEQISFSHNVEIYGMNGTGKTTILDAFLWCLFGKDSSGASDFSVKRKNPDGTDIQHTDVDVCSTLLVDGQTKTLRRRFVEKWTTARGAKEPEFKGNTGEYFVNDVPVGAGEYSTQIAGICREDIFKLLTTAGAFNKLKDADRRKVLSEMADQVSDIELAKDFPHVLEAMQLGKTIPQYREQIRVQKNKIITENDQYPARLKENADMRPKPLDFDALRAKAKAITDQIESLSKKSEPATEVTQTPTVADKIKVLNDQLAEIEQSLTKERDKKKEALQKSLDEATQSKQSLDRKVTDAEQRLEKVKKDITSHEATLKGIVESWQKENARTCTVTVDSACPTCGKEFSADDIVEKKNEIITSFNKDKLDRLKEIKGRGDSESQYVADLKTTKDTIETEIAELRDKYTEASDGHKKVKDEIDALPDLKLLLEANTEYVKLKGQRDTLEASERAEVVPQATEKDPMAEYKEQLEAIRKDLAIEDEIKRADQRREELLSMQAKYGKDIADLEAIEYEIQQFSMLKTGLIEASIASKFKFVRFKMFEYNITNDGVREVCICTVNGVPYPDQNTAGQINADIDIINALSGHYQITAPVFIDHAESINQIEETVSQRIDLYATLTDTSLRIVQK